MLTQNILNLYIFGSVIVVSLLSIIMALPLLIKKSISKTTLLFLLSFSVGILLSTIFMGLLPEAIGNLEKYGETNFILLGLYILIGFLLMFIIENFVHSQHKHQNKSDMHQHAYHLAPINLIGDGIHNFIDGLVIAVTYAVDLTLGIIATISIIFHEIPQEIADFGVLLYSGMSKKKALIFNLLSAIAAIFGALIGILLLGKLDGFITFIIPFAIGNFLYIAASNLVPQLHNESDMKQTFIHIIVILLGIVFITLVSIYGPVHLH